MAVEIGTFLSILSVIVAVTSFAMNSKKTNKTDGFEMGKFMGEMKSEIASIKGLIEELKKDNKEVDERMIKAIREHELRYDDKISRMIAEHEMHYHNNHN